MMRKATIGALASVLAISATAAVYAAEGGQQITEQDWPHQGIFGAYDKAAAQRGFQIYNEVCSACHSMNLLSYRNLSGLDFSPEAIKAIAASKQVTTGPNDQGDMYERPGVPSDHFVPPFKNPQAARAANGGALPPDLSLIIKAREGGEDYVYSVLTGYKPAPSDMKMADGMNYNVAFPGHQIAMPQPLDNAGGTVTYSDGSKPSLSQEAHDVVTFLAWASEPQEDARKQMGLKVMLFLAVFTGLIIAAKRAVWKDVH